MRAWIFLLVFQVLVGANAGIVFSHLPRGVAGLVAGTGFFVFGSIALWMFWKRSIRFQFLNVFVAGFFLVGLSLPMLLGRLMTPFDRPVTDVFGLPLQSLHEPSLYVYKAILALVVVQVGLAFLAKKKLG